MKKFRKVFTFLLGGVMMCSMFAGCGGNKVSYDPDNFIADTSNPQIVKEKVTIKMFVPKHSLHSAYGDMRLFREMEEITNIHVDFVEANTESYPELRSGAWDDTSIDAFLFPEISYWEPSNETNGTDGRFIAMNGYSEAEDAENSQYLYSTDDLAYITADMCWYANAGIKESSPGACTVLPGMIFNTSGETATFLQKIYDQIDSRYLPSGEEYADIEPDHYFQVLNWHPYVGSWGMPSDAWTQANLDIYAVAEKNGDKGKKVFLTELGWQDQNNPESQELIARAFVETIDIIKEKMPWVETFHTFRMFNWDTCPLASDSIERFFGLFTSPNSEAGASPKPVALALCRYFRGDDVDVSGLYQFAVR